MSTTLDAVIVSVYQYFRGTLGVIDSVRSTITATGLSAERVIKALGYEGTHTEEKVLGN